jgi:peptidoglycan/xylan/chitin deacetylase (PgdA/CDA1 family)
MERQKLWDIFSAKQEYERKNLDEYGRVNFENSDVKITRTPVVSNFLFQNGFRPHYPDKKTFAVNLSHDIDHLFYPEFTIDKRLKEFLKEVLQLNLKRAFSYFNPRNPINPYYNIDKILNLEKEYNIRSSFYFLSLQPGDKDFNFKTDEITNLFDLIRENKSEIGLHGGHDAFMDLDRLLLEKNNLEKSAQDKIKGYRNHYLKFKTPDTWNILEKADFSYDTTYGFPDHPGFRNGMCYPFFPYDLVQAKFLKILEIPLLIMDASFIYYLKWDENKTISLCKNLIDQVSAINGVVTILWHNNYYVKPWNKVLTTLLDYCHEKDAWFCTGLELNNWWRQNKFCEQYFQFGLEPIPHE